MRTKGNGTCYIIRSVVYVLVGTVSLPFLILNRWLLLKLCHLLTQIFLASVVVFPFCTRNAKYSFFALSKTVLNKLGTAKGVSHQSRAAGLYQNARGAPERIFI